MFLSCPDYPGTQKYPLVFKSFKIIENIVGNEQYIMNMFYYRDFHRSSQEYKEAGKYLGVEQCDVDIDNRKQQ